MLRRSLQRRPSCPSCLGAVLAAQPLPRLRGAAPLGRRACRSSLAGAGARWSLDPSAPEPGLFAIPGLHNPHDFVSLARDAVTFCDRLLETIVAAPPSAHLLHLMDEMSEQLCRVMDAAELCRNVHPDPDWQNSSNAVYAHLASYIQNLNSTPELHSKLASILSHDRIAATLSAEERIVATQLQDDMERNGVHLPVQQRQRYAALQAEVLELSSAFMENAASANTLVISAARLGSLPGHVQSAFTITADGQGAVVCDRATSSRLLKSVADGQLRRDIYTASNSAAHGNLAVLHKILQCRSEMASLLGAGTYADYVAKGMMAGTTSAIEKFLVGLLERTRVKGRDEMCQLVAAKAEAEGTQVEDTVIHPWDTHYYMSLTKAAVHRIDARDISAYFSLGNCLAGLNLMVERLFQMSLREENCTNGEVWDSSVRKMALHHPVEGVVGHIYLDLHPRAGKHSHVFAQFSIQCGSQRTGRLPSVALVCNFERANGSLLAHGEVETLFHEFGHALHALLSRTYFQHSSGTRTLLDFVETPSTLLEYCVWDESFVADWATHHVSGEPIPSGMISSLRESKHMYGALELQQQLLYAMLDQRYHSEPVADKGWDSTAVFAQLHAECSDPDGSSVAWCAGTHWQSQFSHLVSYGGGYYSYLYSRMFAAHIWRHCFASSLAIDDAAQGGRALREVLLAAGGSRPPQELLCTMLEQHSGMQVDEMIDEMIDGFDEF